jgi:hypothetical protein
MGAGRAEQRTAARRILRSPGGSGSRKNNPACSVTIVALISRAGMMQQHAHRRVSRANSSWEKSMPFKKQLTRHRPLLALAAHRDGKITFPSLRFSSSNAPAPFAGRSTAARPHVHSYQSIDLRRTDGRRTGEDGSIRTRPEQDRSWRFIRATMFGVSARVIGVFAGCGEIAFSGVLFAFMSWTIAQVLAGCAAYAEAMYPCVIDEERPRELPDSVERIARYGDRRE